MARDVRQLRADAAEASAAGKHKRALSLYLELEQLEPRDAQWSKRAAETYRRLGKDKDAIGAFQRAVDRYAQGGFLVQAIAVCKLILSIDPRNDEALRRLSSMNEQVGAGPTRAVSLADANPNLASNQAVAALRRPTGALPVIAMDEPDAVPDESAVEVEPEPPPPIAMPRTRTPHQVTAPPDAPRPPAVPPPRVAPPIFPEPDRNRTPSTPPIAIARTKSKPVQLAPDQPLEAINLKDQVPASFERVEKSGIYVIPIDDNPVEDLVAVEAEGSGEASAATDDIDAYAASVDDSVSDDIDAYAASVGGDGGRDSAPVIEVEDPSDAGDTVEPEDVDELMLDDIEEIPLAEPRIMGAAAADALARTPLFAGLSREALESLVQELTLVTLSAGETLFKEGDIGDALYVIVEGEVAVQAEGPPRVEMARLGAGAFIGEVALMTDQPRSATVSATSDSELLRIDRNTLSAVLDQHGEVLVAVLRFVRDRLVDRWTRTSPLFSPFDDSVRTQLASRFRFLEVDSGSMLLKSNTKPDGLYIVLAGRFDVRRAGAHLATVGPGELIGETALLSGAKFQSDVIADGKSLALCLPASDFRELIMTHPHVLEYIGEAAEHSRKLEIL